MERPWLTFEGQDLYPDVWSKAAALLVGVISTRPFVDGNKRAGVLLTVLILRSYGVPVTHTASDDWFDLATSVAVERQGIEDIAIRLRSMVEKPWNPR
ncbi:type II toxin-antitoxin system death-on-curing family toxin [Corynebacterium aquatimens]|uniref:type II toxin-antitoxin system death-on-curing family toxin n=1 Tax=Corynebacterium aquatimens TaxID=1190508 RepID=UPI003F490D0E